jgi:hypothetical protein
MGLCWCFRFSTFFSSSSCSLLLASIFSSTAEFSDRKCFRSSSLHLVSVAKGKSDFKRERERERRERERLDITLSIKCTRVLVVQIWKINVTRDTESERERASERWQGSMIDSSIAKGFLFALARIAHSITPIIDFLFGVLNVKLDAIH